MKRQSVIFILPMALSLLTAGYCSAETVSFFDFTGEGINNSGRIVGQWYTSSGSSGAVFDGTNTIILGQFGIPGSPSGINNNGTIVSWDRYLNQSYVYDSPNFGGTSYTTHDGGFSDINDAGTIVGTFAGESEQGFYLDGDGYHYFDAPNSELTFANGINNSGQIVGSKRTSTNGGGIYNGGGSYTGYLLDQGVFTEIVFPGSPVTVLTDINNFGQISGFYQVYDSQEVFRPFIYDSGSFYTFSFPTERFTQAWGINDHGEIVGYFGDNMGFIATLGDSFQNSYPFEAYHYPTAPVPEPSTMLLLGSGLVGLVGYGRRQLKK